MTNKKPYKKQENNNKSLSQRWKAALEKKIEVQNTEQDLKDAQEESKYYKMKVRQLAQNKTKKIEELMESLE